MISLDTYEHSILPTNCKYLTSFRIFYSSICPNLYIKFGIILAYTLLLTYWARFYTFCMQKIYQRIHRYAHTPITFVPMMKTSIRQSPECKIIWEHWRLSLKVTIKIQHRKIKSRAIASLIAYSSLDQSFQ